MDQICHLTNPATVYFNFFLFPYDILIYFLLRQLENSKIDLFSFIEHLLYIKLIGNQQKEKRCEKTTNRIMRFKLNCLQQHGFEIHTNGKDIVKASDSKSHS